MIDDETTQFGELISSAMDVQEIEFVAQHAPGRARRKVIGKAGLAGGVPDLDDAFETLEPWRSGVCTEPLRPDDGAAGRHRVLLVLSFEVTAAHPLAQGIEHIL